MIHGKEGISAYLRANNSPFWKLRDRSGTNLIAESAENESLTIEGSINVLCGFLEMLRIGDFSLESWTTVGQKKDRFKTLLTLNNGDANPAMNGPFPVIPQAAPVDMEAQIQKAVESALKAETAKNYLANLEAENTRLKQRVAELEAEGNLPTERIAKRLEPFVGTLLAAINGESTAAIGNGENTEQEQQRLISSLEKWNKYEPDLAVVVEKIANLSENNPAMYSTAKNLLASQ